VVLAPAIIPVAVAIVLCWLVASAGVMFAVSLLWFSRGVSFLVVYSDSAQWKRYFEEEVIPAFWRPDQVVGFGLVDLPPLRWVPKSISNHPAVFSAGDVEGHSLLRSIHAGKERQNEGIGRIESPRRCLETEKV
jgi:hypothetical protein